MHRVITPRHTLIFCALLAAALLPGSALAQDAGPDREAPEPSRAPSSGTEPRVDADARGNPYVAGELILTLEEDVSGEEAAAAAADAGARVEGTIADLDAAVVAVPGVLAEDSGAERERDLARTRAELLADPDVESVDYNYVRTLSATPDDPRFAEQWGLKRIEAPAAWDSFESPFTAGAGSVIAIVDGGASGAHRDLEGAFVGAYDYYDGDAVPNDEDGHGTHVSGIAAARADDGRGIAGTAPGASLLNYDVCGATFCEDFAINEAIRDAADSGADVINMSLGGSGQSNAQRNAVDYAWGQGTVLVAAAGNEARDGNPVSYPAAYPNVIAVGATTPSNTRASFSNHGSYVDVAAPGTGILSSIPPQDYDSWNGTSMATPFVSGVAALLAARGLGAEEIRTRIEGTATDLGARGRDDDFGYGLVDADAAVASGGTTPPPTGGDTTPPEVSASSPVPEERGIPRRSVVTATLSETLDRGSVAGVNVQLYPNGSKRPVAASVACDATCRTVTLDPDGRLASRTWYMAVLWADGAGVRDLAGNPVQSSPPYATERTTGGYDYVYWWFRTGR